MVTEIIAKNAILHSYLQGDIINYEEHHDFDHTTSQILWSESLLNFFLYSLFKKMANIVENFKLLFDRPNEPMVSPKGDENVLFQLTEQFLVSLFVYLYFFLSLDGYQYLLNIFLEFTHLTNFMYLNR